MSRFAFSDELDMLREEIRNTAPHRADIRGVARYARGVVDGYYRAGAINELERDGGRKSISDALNSRLAVFDLERQARAEGLA